MGLFSMLRTSASGMAAQANRLSTVADNIANFGTTGYKRASAEFSSLILQSSKSEYNSGSVETAHALRHQRARLFQVHDLRHRPRRSRATASSSSATTKGQTFLTRAGSFVPDGEGNLVNAAGFKLMGYSLTGGDAQYRRQRHRRAAAGQRGRRSRCRPIRPMPASSS